MGHPEIHNTTPFAFEPLHLLDEEGRAVLVAVVKGTFEVDPAGRCSPASEQVAVNMAGQNWGDPATTSYRYEPELALVKVATDVVLVGHAYPARPNAAQVSVALEAGSLVKRAQVFGDRAWYRAGTHVGISPPRPFERMPLCYERAFGGWDRSARNPAEHACDRRNPVGTGFRAHGSFAEGTRLPNVEDPKALIRALTDHPEPVGFGFVSADWLQRARWSGTYDERWQRERAPLLPRDFDRRFFNAASVGLIAKGYFRGHEQVAASGVMPGGRPFVAKLPARPAPSVRVRLRVGPVAQIETVLDTLIIEPDEGRVQLLWRGHLRLRSGPHDVRAVEVA
jgi:hypothetical protein